MEQKPDISLVICTRNRNDMIIDVLNSAQSQTFDKSQFEVLILDQSTNEETKKIAENYKDFKYIKLNSTGIAISRNEGIKLSQGEIIAFVDDDVYFDKDYLQSIHDFFKFSELKPDMVGGKTILDLLGEKPKWLEKDLFGILATADYGDEPKLYDGHIKHVPYTCNMAVKRECAEAIGEFSMFYKMNEDVLFAQSAKEKGFVVAYNPKMTVHHKISQDRMTYNYYKSRYYCHGMSDAHLYYYLNQYSKKDIPLKIGVHFSRIIESLVVKYTKKTPYDIYYQKLRLYYNAGYIKSLFDILIKGNK